MVKSILKKILPEDILAAIVKKKYYWHHYAMKTYSQEGEDAVLRKIFQNKKIGFYVDVGSHHPWSLSNTQIFYENGWRGINIDAMPGSMKVFQRYRKRDINLEIAVSDIKEKLMYYAFNEPALNGFSKQISQKRDNHSGYKIIFSKEIETKTLKEILDQYLMEDQKIDFFNIDVEGYDFKVLLSNDWTKYRPSIILVELLDSNFQNLGDDQIVKYLKEKGYEIFGKTGNTVIFKEQLFKC